MMQRERTISVVEHRWNDSYELSAPVLDSLQDLTNQLEGRSNYLIASGDFEDIWKCELVKLNGTR
jgi:hypothetical protein